MNRRRNIILIGFMGCGKSTVGIRLSYRLKVSTEDTDKLIERRQGRTINEIFAREGEGYFRSLETETLKELLNRKQAYILSVGGGTPVQPQNRELLKKGGIVIYLRIRPENVWKRLQHDESRPLLQCENPLERIQSLMKEREEAYEECAHIIVDVDELSMDEVLSKVQDALRSYHRREALNTPGEKPLHKLLVINGPNINFLGIREKSIYGTRDYACLLQMIAQKAKETRCSIPVFQSNHEGAVIDRIQDAYFDGTQGIVINPGAYTHYSYAIHDALASIQVPKCEIHISDITRREDFRKISVTAPACHNQIYGQGLDGYLQAIDFVLDRINEKQVR